MSRRRRSKPFSPLVIGITGSIGMGKSVVSRMFARLGVPVCDSDAIVHRLLFTGGAAVQRIAELFPATRGEYGIDRKLLGKEVFGNASALAALEAVMHPLVRTEQQKFIRHMQRMGVKRVALDIPLLFETDAQLRCDYVVAVHAPPFIQRQRVMARAGMTQERFERIVSLQLPSRAKCRHADKVIQTGLGKALSFREVKNWLLLIHDKVTQY